MQGFKEIVKKANDIINKKTIFSCEFESITPWWGGGADGSTSEHVDEDEIAGRLRWFLRTVYNRFCASSDDLKSYRKSMAWVGQLLGSSVNGKSPYIIHTESRAITKINKRKAPIDNLNLSLKIILNGSVYKDAISDDEQKKYNEIISSATLLTLAYIGIGKRANRGFGRFYPKNCRYLNENNTNNITKVVEEKIKEGKVEEAFSSFYDFFKKNVCKNSLINSWNESLVPLAPLVNSKDNDECTIINTYKCRLPIRSLLKIIKDAVAKQIQQKLPKSSKFLRIQSILIIIAPYSKDSSNNQGVGIAILPFLSKKDHEETLKKPKEHYKDRIINEIYEFCKVISKTIKEKCDNKEYYDNKWSQQYKKNKNYK